MWIVNAPRRGTGRSREKLDSIVAFFEWSSVMPQRHFHFKETELLEDRLERERLMRQARQAERGAQISEWLRSPGLQLPK